MVRFMAAAVSTSSVLAFGTRNNDGAIVYDNQLTAPDGAEPTIVLGGGSIIIHKWHISGSPRRA